ncbi:MULTISPECIES: transcriptional regulator [unclassified Crossiella]|uniref:AfsR/SARP family transcriptional regulator n=1 Tax=unclassified Crossiella TaxID=2620835 RepID=UPI001FFE83B4|nr:MULTISPECIES: transcriptional regulator [unclassified Crossiella]MCK2240135.1 transcriptional regulator [Crossiella sp. S99.2]MCK2253413.1 transcriptional regulator [Crossiella sp. S99.1]
MTELDFRVLGPLQVTKDGQPLRIGAAQHRILLACLLLNPRRPVAAETIAGHLWPADGRPRNPRGAVHTYVQRLRGQLGAAAIRTVEHGYLLDVPAEAVDLHRFAAHLRRADEAQDTAAEHAELTAALAQWRGEAFADVPAPEFATPETARWAGLRLTALARRIQLDLDRGEHNAVIGELQLLTRQHPVHEVFWSQLMLALYRAQRPAEAVQAYATAAATLHTELQVQPGPRLRWMHEAVLTNAPELAPPAAPAVLWRPACQLPSDIGDFTGRREELRALTGLLVRQQARRVLVCGQPGIGKTALAVRAGHLLRPAFPDGQLYVNLRGFCPGERLDPAQVLGQFLRALGVPADQVPYRSADRISKYRALLAGRRVLVLLDNAGSAEQLLPLLPDSPGSAGLVTSRNALSTVDTPRIRLDPLGEQDSLALIGAILGGEHLAAHPAAATELAGLCARLPLALRIAAANLTIRGEPDLPGYVHELATGNRLAALAIDGDDDAAVHRAFDLSYGTLSVAAQRLFRLLGLVPGPDFTAAHAAALTGFELARAEELLQALATAHLVQEHREGRYQFHDLLRLYTGQQRDLEDSPEEVSQARQQLFDYLLDCANYGTVLLYAEAPRNRAVVGKLAPFDEPVAAKHWLDEERATLIATVLATEDRPDELCVDLATALTNHFWTNGHFEEQVLICETGLRAAIRRGYVIGQADMHNGLSGVLSLYGRVADAVRHGTRSVLRYREVGGLGGEGLVLANIAMAYEVACRFPRAIARYTKAIRLSREARYPAGEAYASQGLHSAYVAVGRLTEAKERIEHACKIMRRHHAHESEAQCLVQLADTLAALGEFTEAEARLAEAAALARRLGGLQERMVAEARARLQLARADLPGARAHLDRALAVAVDNSRDRLAPGTRTLIADIHRGHREWARAHHHYLAARELANAAGHPAFPVLISVGLSAVHRGLHEPAEALPYAVAAEHIARAGGLRTVLGDALTELAEVRLALGEAAPAAELAEAALALHRDTGRRPAAATALEVLGNARSVLDGPAAACPLWTEALALYRELGMVDRTGLAARLAAQGAAP